MRVYLHIRRTLIFFLTSAAIGYVIAWDWGLAVGLAVAGIIHIIHDPVKMSHLK